jgi:hypothetical protein
MWWHSSQAPAQTNGPCSPYSLTSPENEASHDVVIQIRRLITQLSQRLAPPTDTLDDEVLGGAERVAGEGVVFLRICICYLSVVCKILAYFYSMLCFPFATELQLKATHPHHGEPHGDAQPVEELGYIPDTRCEFQ